jgi:hypothetical protein
MTIFTRDLDRGAWLVVEIAIAVRILTEVTIDAVHPTFGVNVVKMHGLAELRRIVGRDQIACASSRLPLRSRLKTLRNNQP